MYKVVFVLKSGKEISFKYKYGLAIVKAMMIFSDATRTRVYEKKGLGYTPILVEGDANI
jgi:hypothetical protein